jgi:hypothetical protein
MRKLSLLALILGFAACRDSAGGGDDQPTIDSSTGGSDVKIQDIQNEAMTSGTAVSIKGVVVTAIDNYGGKTGDFWIQEPEGGEFSGLHVFGAPLDQVAALTVGDIIDISGAEKDEFQYMDFDPGYGITELKPLSGGMMTITKTGMTMVLQPQLVDARMIGGLQDYVARHAEWEKWEGVLIKIENVTATSDSACVGTACNDDTLNKFDVTGDVVVESALSAIPDPAVVEGDCLGSVTGVLDYFFDYLLLPRSTNEIALNGTACPAENTMALCTDGIDNDTNGFMDCEDNACVAGVATCRTVNPTIASIQAGTTTGGVEIQDAYVIAVSVNKNEVWIATDNAAAINTGIQVHFQDDVDTSVVVVGKKVNVIGRVTEFANGTTGGTLTEINAYSIEVLPGAAMAPTALTVAATTLNDDTTGEPYESVLVTLTNVKITTIANAASFGVGSMTQGTEVFKFDDAIHRLADAGTLDTCYATITGVWSYNVYDDFWVFLPHAAATKVTCP